LRPETQAAGPVLLDEAEDLINYQSYDNAREKLIKSLELNHRMLKLMFYWETSIISNPT